MVKEHSPVPATRASTASFLSSKFDAAAFERPLALSELLAVVAEVGELIAKSDGTVSPVLSTAVEEVVPVVPALSSDELLLPPHAATDNAVTMTVRYEKIRACIMSPLLMVKNH